MPVANGCAGMCDAEQLLRARINDVPDKRPLSSNATGAGYPALLLLQQLLQWRSRPDASSSPSGLLL